MEALLHNARFEGMGYSGENTVNEPGAMSQSYGATVSGYMNALARWGQEIGTYLAHQQGIQPGTPEYGAFMEQTVKTIMQASDPQAVGQQLLGISTDPNVRTLGSGGAK